MDSKFYDFHLSSVFLHFHPPLRALSTQTPLKSSFYQFRVSTLSACSFVTARHFHLGDEPRFSLFSRLVGSQANVRSCISLTLHLSTSELPISCFFIEFSLLMHFYRSRIFGAFQWFLSLFDGERARRFRGNIVDTHVEDLTDFFGKLLVNICIYSSIRLVIKEESSQSEIGYYAWETLV